MGDERSIGWVDVVETAACAALTVLAIDEVENHVAFLG